ncbi:MAG: phosphatidylcholine synthase [Methylocystis sp.]|nr:phosphatidylcholine synthase [Methylocystis sp.]
MLSRIKGFCVHAFTASGAALGLLALFSAIEGRFTAMFAWLGLALLVDAVDGALARRFKVAETVPHIDGALLDLVVDFLAYVVVPMVALWRSGLLEPPHAMALGCFVGAASALYFADRRMKTKDLWFRGFPAAWNFLLFYLMILRPPPVWCALVIIAAALLMFAPVVFAHPLRVARFRPATITVTALWAVAAIVALDQGLAGATFGVKAALVLAALYFLALPLLRGPSAH